MARRHITPTPADRRRLADFAARLRSARKAAGLSGRELARRAGVASSLVTFSEWGKQSVGIVVLGRLADALATTSAALLEPMPSVDITGGDGDA